MLAIDWNAVYGFWLVARHGSFAEAARKLPWGTAQALHKRVRRLEDKTNLDLRLLSSRGVKGVELTAAGDTLYQLIDPVFRDFEAVALDLRKEANGPITVATTGFVVANYLPAILKRLHKNFPKVSLLFRVRAEAEVVSLVKSGVVDFGIAPPPLQGTSLVTIARTPLQFRFVAPPDQAVGRKIGWPEICRMPLVLHERISILRQALEQVLAQQNLLSGLQIVAEVTTPELAVDMVRAGIGVALVPLGPQLTKTLGGLKTFPPPSGLPEISLAILHRKDRYIARYMQGFIEAASIEIQRSSKL